VGVFRRLDPDRICRAGRHTQRAADALLQPVIVAFQRVTPLVALAHRALLLRELDGNFVFKQMLEDRHEAAYYIHQTLACLSRPSTVATMQVISARCVPGWRATPSRRCSPRQAPHRSPRARRGSGTTARRPGTAPAPQLRRLP